jgi:hypothetical protein
VRRRCSWTSKEGILIDDNSGRSVESSPSRIRDGETAGHNAKSGGVMGGHAASVIVGDEEWRLERKSMPHGLTKRGVTLLATFGRFDARFVCR